MRVKEDRKSVSAAGKITECLEAVPQFLFFEGGARFVARSSGT